MGALKPIKSEVVEVVGELSVCTGAVTKTVLLRVMAKDGLTEEDLRLVISVLDESEYWQREFLRNVVNPIVCLRGKRSDL